MKKKYFLLISFLFLAALFIKDFYLRQVRATSSWYATFIYNDKTYAFSHNWKQTDWNSIIPGFPNSVNPDPDGNAGVKGQDWCNHTLIIDGEDNHYDDWFLPNEAELEKSRNYDREKGNPWDPLGRDAKLWSSSTNPFIGRYHRASATAEESGYNLDKVVVEYARCVRIVTDSSPTPTASPSPSPSPTPPPDFKLLLSNWGSANPDLNGDGLVNGLDFGKLKSQI